MPSLNWVKYNLKGSSHRLPLRRLIVVCRVPALFWRAERVEICTRMIRKPWLQLRDTSESWNRIDRLVWAHRIMIMKATSDKKSNLLIIRDMLRRGLRLQLVLEWGQIGWLRKALISCILLKIMLWARLQFQWETSIKRAILPEPGLTLDLPLYWLIQIKISEAVSH